MHASSSPISSIEFSPLIDMSASSQRPARCSSQPSLPLAPSPRLTDPSTDVPRQTSQVWSPRRTWRSLARSLLGLWCPFALRSRPSDDCIIPIQHPTPIHRDNARKIHSSKPTYSTPRTEDSNSQHKSTGCKTQGTRRISQSTLQSPTATRGKRGHARHS